MRGAGRHVDVQEIFNPVRRSSLPNMCKWGDGVVAIALGYGCSATTVTIRTLRSGEGPSPVPRPFATSERAEITMNSETSEKISPELRRDRNPDQSFPSLSERNRSWRRKKAARVQE